MTNHIKITRTLFILLLYFALPARLLYAQPELLTLSVPNSFFTQNGTLHDTHTTDKFRRTDILPMLSYYHHVKNNWGIALSAGKNFQLYQYNREIVDSSGSSLITSQNSVDEKLFALAVGVYESFSFKKYYLNLPVWLSYRHYLEASQHSVTRYGDGTTAYYAMVWPQINQLGLQFNPAVYRKIYKHLYLGAELRFELFADYKTGSSRETSYTTDNGITRDYIYSEQKYKGVVGVFFNSIGYGIGILYRFGEK